MPDTGILTEPLEVGGSTARVIEGTSESLPYTMKFIDPDDTILPGWFDANGVLQVLGRVVEVVLTEDGTPHTADVRRVGSVKALEPPVLELHLIDESAFDRTTLFEFNPTIQVAPVGPDFDNAEGWAGVARPGANSPTFSGNIAATSGDFRQAGVTASTRKPQFDAIVGDVIASPVANNTLGNFKNLILEVDGVDRPITSFGSVAASTPTTIVDPDAWDTGTPGDKDVPNPWFYWPGGPTSGTFAYRLHFGGGPGVPTTPEMPYLIDEAEVRGLLTAVMDGSFGGTPMRFQLPSTADLPVDLLGGVSLRLAVPGPTLRRDFLVQVAKLAGLVLWFDGLGRLSPRPWPVPPIADFTQVQLDAMYRFDGTTAITAPTYEVTHSQSFNVWQAEGLAVYDVGGTAAVEAGSPFFQDAILPALAEQDETASSPITSNRIVHNATLPSLVMQMTGRTGPTLTGPGSVAEAFIDATLGGLAEGRIRGHATTDAPVPGDLVLIDHDDLRGVNPATGARSGLQLARVVDKRRVYSDDEVSFEYRVIYGGRA